MLLTSLTLTDDVPHQYVVMLHGWPDPGYNVLGSFRKMHTAQAFADAMIEAPGATKAQVFDSHDNDKLLYECRITD